ncbi:aspergillopepsin I [Ranunculus cassubicifolius]
MCTLSPFLLSSILSIFLLPLVFGRRDGLSIKLIHRDSIESPLYVANRTIKETFATLSYRSNIHLKQLAETTANPEHIRPPVTYDSDYYLARVGIGTIRGLNPVLPPKSRSYYLAVSTASSLIWLQCENCNPCFQQKEPFYPFSRSLTYRYLLCANSHPCEFGECDEGRCTYRTGHADSGISEGVVSTERFTFNSHDEALESVDSLYFGCGLSQKNFHFREGEIMNQVSGVMGLGRGPMSLITQLGVRAMNQFSYCLQPRFNGGTTREISTFLRFGADASFKPWHAHRVQTIHLLPHGDNYYVGLQGISLARRRLKINPSAFIIREDGTGGVEMDVGSALTLISRPEYNIMRERMHEIFGNMGLQEIPPPGGLDLCYNIPEGFNNYPSMTLHFLNDVRLEILPGQLFLTAPTLFCSAIIPHDQKSFSVKIGSHMQANYRFVYKLNTMVLEFLRENCDKDK